MNLRPRVTNKYTDRKLQEEAKLVVCNRSLIVVDLIMRMRTTVHEPFTSLLQEFQLRITLQKYVPVFLYSIAVCTMYWTCNTSCSYSSTDHWLVSWLDAKVASLRDLFGLRSPAVFIVVLTSIQLFQSLSARVPNRLLEIKRCLCGFTIIILEVY